VNAVRILMTPQRVAELLRLPSGTVISSANPDLAGNVVLIAQHADLPPVPAGGEPLIATPLYRKDAVVTEPAVHFVEWGIWS